MLKSAGSSSCPIHGGTNIGTASSAGHINNGPPVDENTMFFRVEGVTKRDLDKAGKVKVVVNDEDIALISHNGKLYAVREKCPHNGGPLHEGDIEDIPSGGGLCIKCPWHGWKFNLTTGQCVSPPNRLSRVMTRFPTRLDSTGQIISIGFDKIAPSCFTEPL